MLIISINKKEQIPMVSDYSCPYKVDQSDISNFITNVHCKCWNTVVFYFTLQLCHFNVSVLYIHFIHQYFTSTKVFVAPILYQKSIRIDVLMYDVFLIVFLIILF